MKHITCMTCTLLIARIPTLVCIHSSIQLIYLLTVYSSDEWSFPWINPLNQPESDNLSEIGWLVSLFEQTWNGYSLYTLHMLYMCDSAFFLNWHPPIGLMSSAKYKHIDIDTFTHKYLHIPVYTYLYLPTYLPTYMHTCVQACICMYVYTVISVHMYM